MTTTILDRRLAAVLLVGLLWGGAGALADNAVSLGVREHGLLKDMDNYPFDRGDLSIVGGYEYHEEAAFWQVAVGYCMDPSASGTADYAITPQLSLLFKDQFYRGGLGVMKTYVKDDGTGNAEDGSKPDEWTPFYWQWILGIGVPIGKWLTIDAYAYYTFEKWGDFFGSLDWEGFEFGLSCSVKF